MPVAAPDSPFRSSPQIPLPTKVEPFATALGETALVDSLRAQFGVLLRFTPNRKLALRVQFGVILRFVPNRKLALELRQSALELIALVPAIMPVSARCLPDVSPICRSVPTPRPPYPLK